MFCYVDLVKLCMIAASWCGWQEVLDAAGLCPAPGAEWVLEAMRWSCLQKTIYWSWLAGVERFVLMCCLEVSPAL